MYTVKIEGDSKTVLGKSQMDAINNIIANAIEIGAKVEVKGIVYDSRKQ